MGGEILHPGGEFDLDILRGARGVGQRRLQIAAMDRPVWRAIAALGIAAQRNAHNLAARAARHHADRLWHHHRGLQAFA
jgi:hypothetical protein